MLFFDVPVSLRMAPFFRSTPFSEVSVFPEMGYFRNALLLKISVALFRTWEGRIGGDSGRFDREILDRLLSLTEYCALLWKKCLLLLLF